MVIKNWITAFAFTLQLFPQLGLSKMTGVSTTDTHFCLLVKGEVKCYDSKGLVETDTFKYPFAIYGGGNNQCVHDYNGVHCWNWEDRNIIEYPELSDVQNLKVSKGYVCGKNKDKPWQCLLAPKSHQKVLPFLPDNRNSLLVLDNWICFDWKYSQIYQDDKLIIECYHPERPVGDPLKITWTYPRFSVEVGISARNNTLALVFGYEHDRDETDRQFIEVNRWNLPESPLGSIETTGSTSWKKFDHHEDYGHMMERHTFTPQDNFGNSLYLLENADVFLTGRHDRQTKNELVNAGPKLGLVYDSEFANEEKAGFLDFNPKPSEFTKYKEEFKEIFKSRTSMDFPLFSDQVFAYLEKTELEKQQEDPWDWDKDKLGSYTDKFADIFDWKASYFPLFMNGTFACVSREQLTRDYHMKMENLPTEKSAFAMALLKTLKPKQWVETYLFLELVQPILESTNSEIYREMAWREGMKLGFLRHKLEIQKPLSSEAVALLSLAQSKLGTEEEIKQSPWRRQILERINYYLNEGSFP